MQHRAFVVGEAAPFLTVDQQGERRLRAKSGQRTHGADHEVLEDLGALLAVLVPVGGEGGDLGAVGAALEGAVERRRRGVTGLHGGAAGPGDGHLVGCP